MSAEEQRDEQQDARPPRVEPRLKAAPKIRQIYWCDFWEDAVLPEMWKRRPVIVLSPKSQLYGVSLVVACSTDPQEGNSAKWAHKLSFSLDGRDTYVVCNHLYTVSVSRLSADRRGILFVGQPDFDAILAKVQQALPRFAEQASAETV